jgi:hypothetical protein
MGFLSKLLGKSEALIKRSMEKTYVPQLMEVMDISLPQAQVTFIKLLEQTRHESSDMGTSKLPENYGDVLLSREGEDEQIRSMLESRRTEGVRDEDVRWWWNMHDLERRMMLKVDEQRRTTQYLRHRQSGLSKGEAGARVRMYYPTYGDPDDLPEANPDDNHLPHELKRRIDRYIQKRLEVDGEALKKEMEAATTFNALVRKEIKNGNL